MSSARTGEMARRLTENGFLNFGAALSQLFMAVLRKLSAGRPVTPDQVAELASALDVPAEEAHEFLGRLSERGADGSIAGLMGLSLNDHPHRFTLGSRRLSAWCAMDTLFLPTLLGETATIESQSPVSKETVKVTVSPHGVEQLHPAQAVVSLIVPKDFDDLKSPEAVWGSFCHHVFFFVSREEAEGWAGGREDIEILSVAEGFALGKELCSSVLV